MHPYCEELYEASDILIVYSSLNPLNVDLLGPLFEMFVDFAALNSQAQAKNRI